MPESSPEPNRGDWKKESQRPVTTAKITNPAEPATAHELQDCELAERRTEERSHPINAYGPKAMKKYPKFLVAESGSKANANPTAHAGAEIRRQARNDPTTMTR